MSTFYVYILPIIVYYILFTFLYFATEVEAISLDVRRWPRIFWIVGLLTFIPIFGLILTSAFLLIAILGMIGCTITFRDNKFNKFWF